MTRSVCEKKHTMKLESRTLVIIFNEIKMTIILRILAAGIQTRLLSEELTIGNLLPELIVNVEDSFSKRWRITLGSFRLLWNNFIAWVVRCRSRIVLDYCSERIMNFHANLSKKAVDTYPWSLEIIVIPKRWGNLYVFFSISVMSCNFNWWVTSIQ